MNDVQLEMSCEGNRSIHWECSSIDWTSLASPSPSSDELLNRREHRRTALTSPWNKRWERSLNWCKQQCQWSERETTRNAEWQKSILDREDTRWTRTNRSERTTHFLSLLLVQLPWSSHVQCTTEQRRHDRARRYADNCSVTISLRWTPMDKTICHWSQSERERSSRRKDQSIYHDVSVSGEELKTTSDTRQTTLDQCQTASTVILQAQAFHAIFDQVDDGAKRVDDRNNRTAECNRPQMMTNSDGHALQTQTAIEITAATFRFHLI